MARARLRVNVAAWQVGGVAAAEFDAFDQGQYASIREEGGAYTLTDNVSVGLTDTETWTWALPVVFNPEAGATLNVGSGLLVSGTATWIGVQTFGNSAGGATFASGSTLTLANGAVIALATGSSVSLGTAIAISGTATWAGIQTFSAGAYVASLTKGAAGNTVKCALLAGFGQVLQTAGTQNITAIYPSFEDVTSAAINLGNLLDGDRIVIDVGPLFAGVASSEGILQIYVTDASGSTGVAMATARSNPSQLTFGAQYTVNGDGAVSVKLRAAVSTAITMTLTLTDLCPFIRTVVYR